MSENIYKDGDLITTAQGFKLDASLSISSKNMVQNKAITTELYKVKDQLVELQEDYDKTKLSYDDFTENTLPLLGTTLLWKNDSPTTAMASGATITLSSDDYDYLDIIFLRTTANESVQSVRVRKGDSAFLQSFMISSSNFSMYHRSITYTDDTTLTSGTPYKFSASLSSFARSTDTTACIPIAIYGGHFA